MWQTILNYVLNNPIEILGSLLTVVSIWLNTRQNIWGWVIGILSIICYIYIFASIWLLGDFLLNIYFFITSIYGWYHWKYGTKEDKSLPVSRSSMRELVLLIGIGAVSSFLLGVLFSTYPEASFPYWDAVVAAFSLVAQWLLTRKKLENWLIWIFVDVQASLIYFYKDLIATSILYVLLTLLAVKGYLDWKKDC